MKWPDLMDPEMRPYLPLIMVAMIVVGVPVLPLILYVFLF